MLLEILRVWQGKIDHKDYLCHFRILVSDANFLEVTEWIKDGSEKGGKRFNRAELFGVRTCKMDGSVWRNKEGKLSIKTPIDIPYENHSRVTDQCIKALEMQGKEVF